MTKVQILKNKFGAEFEKLFGEWANDQWLHAAMDEYAKQKGIAFNVWLGANYDFNDFEQSWGKFWTIDENVNDGFDKIDINQLWDEFLKTNPE